MMAVLKRANSAVRLIVTVLIMAAMVFAAVLMIVAACPAYAEGYSAKAAPRAVALGSELLADGCCTADAQTVWYAGRRWRVISYDDEGNKYLKRSGAMTLYEARPDSRSIQFRESAEGPEANDYAGSKLQDAVDAYYNEMFEGEWQKPVLERELEVDEYKLIIDPGKSIEVSNGVSGTATSGYLWPLSTAEEMEMGSVYRYTVYPFWLRSPGESDDKAAYIWTDIIDTDYSLIAEGDTVTEKHGFRPAFYLDLNAVLFIAAKNAKNSSEPGPDALKKVGTNDTKEWEMTILDDGTIEGLGGHKDFTINRYSVAYDSDTETVTIPYSGASTGGNEYISAIIKNSKGEVTYYGKVASDLESKGYVTIDLKGKLESDDTLYVFNERDLPYDGYSYQNSNLTDYASALYEVPIRGITAMEMGAGILAIGAGTDDAQTVWNYNKLWKVGAVDPEWGWINLKYPGDPGMTVYPSEVLFLSAYKDGKSSGKPGKDALTEVAPDADNKEWRITLLDDGSEGSYGSGHKDFAVGDIKTCDGAVIRVEYSGAVVNTDNEIEYISAVIVNDGVVKYYGRIKALTADEDKSGVVKIDVKDKLDEAAGDKLYVFNEKYYGDTAGFEGQADYSSWIKEITIPEPTGHDFPNTYAHDNDKHWRACSHCADIEEGPHTWNKGVIMVKPTYTFKGIIKYTCTTCGFSRTESIPMLKVSGTPLVQMKSKGKKALVITWTKSKGAKGYDIFFAKNGKKLRKVKTVKAGAKLKWTKKKLKKGKAYKACVKAWVMKKGKKTYVNTSPTVYAFTSKGTKKYTDPKSVKVKKAKVSLKKGKTFKIKAKVIKLNRNKKLKAFTKKLRYISSNTKVATVNKSGRIKAKAAGTCKIYVYATNGVKKKITVKVKN